MELHFILFSAELSRPVYFIPNVSYYHKSEETKPIQRRPYILIKQQESSAYHFGMDFGMQISKFRRKNVILKTYRLRNGMALTKLTHNHNRK